ncbi:CheB methylesterase domain-containing protein [Pueribacillus sp. YX66]|uniref:CheB methylesterase domain-containing protein n=1 Tax=Pueribacillus sp. YX66 TaxID=3229242 RepID=UPI00358D19F9
MSIKQLVCIGTSTGGPRALQQLLPQFPKGLSSPILIVQHMPPIFTKQLAERLNMISNIEIKEAEHHEIIKSGTAYIAPGGMHMTVNRLSKTELQINLDLSEPIKGHRPSLDRLFQSLKKLKEYRIVSAILTGMGSDGTNGLKALSQSHYDKLYSIAESEKSCIVFGMPKAAIQANVVDEIVELNQMFNTIMKQLQ